MLEFQKNKDDMKFLTNIFQSHETTQTKREGG
jgi:hypothetical protein